MGSFVIVWYEFQLELYVHPKFHSMSGKNDLVLEQNVSTACFSAGVSSVLV